MNCPVCEKDQVPYQLFDLFNPPENTLCNDCREKVWAWIIEKFKEEKE